MSNRSYQSGLAGEEKACKYLENQGYQVQATRYRAQGGEIDIIARDGTYLVFIEVKYRPDDRISTGLRAVTGDKRARMRRAASAYMANLPRPARMRFDILEITRAGVWHKKNVGMGP
ncbi:MAG: YraN family protein [Christensenellales bacterium]|jgi:putative endonuclease